MNEEKKEVLEMEEQKVEELEIQNTFNESSAEDLIDEEGVVENVEY